MPCGFDSRRPHHRSARGKLMQRRRFLTLASGAMLAACAPDAPEDPQAALRSGGHVIYLRHARSVMHAEPAIRDLADCAWQRNLSEEGRAQAAELGERVRSLGLPVGEVLSSAFCRCRDTVSRSAKGKSRSCSRSATARCACCGSCGPPACGPPDRDSRPFERRITHYRQALTSQRPRLRRSCGRGPPGIIGLHAPSKGV
jgi:hypothetical protein